MIDLRKLEDERSRKHWAFVEETSKRVEGWPSWKQAAATTPSAARLVDARQTEADLEPKPYLALAGD